MSAHNDRTPAAAPASTVNRDFVPVICTMSDVDVLAQHGISVGIRNGILSVERKYGPAVSAILSKSKGQQ